MVKIILQGQPVAKGRVRFNRKTGQAFTPDRTVAYESMLALAAQGAMAGRLPMQGPLVATVVAELQIPASWSKKKQQQAFQGQLRPTGRPDLDNYAKILDALNLIVWVDDSQIVELRVSKCYTLKPKLIIEVAQLDDFLA